MPIRRRGDGEIVEEPTNPQTQRQAGRSEAPASEAPTEPASAPLGDSLFAEAPDSAQERWESATKPMSRADPNREGKTRILSPGRRRAAAAEGRAAQADPMADPPVGWLVVVRGPGKGNALALGNGMNAIGRGASSRVRLDFGDDNISRANHARLAYDPRERRWLLSHGDGSNLTYLNGELVMSSVEIESGAEIQIGETSLRFQAFCSKEFDWPDVDD